ncbi:hypothetical protein KGQ20_16465 [Catenulispora sp. NF23]|uniref:Guanylate cyclase domain-containing protein n=1 Tax=Catenulispora pinistramenti TaxID=2705254 RepID=A0ABS5KYN5_9ACTN|nr:hypothetical protein [Catenulispora pinistramenti]MBS2534365.1 hypothetical protein [Catenulispora pinistramenti]MBS2551182.1 hypothetical protein [Catenulispora pinistramenti]
MSGVSRTGDFQLPDDIGLFAADLQSFTALPSALHAPTSRLLEQLVDEAFAEAGLDTLIENKLFPENRGDSIVFGFGSVHLPRLICPGIDAIDAALARFNERTRGKPIRARVSIHSGRVPAWGAVGDGNGKARNDLHRVLDCRQLKNALADASPHTTSLVAAISDRVYEDVVVAGYCTLHADRFTEIFATVDGKTFGQRAWLYVPRPSGNLLKGVAEVAGRESGIADTAADARNPRPGRSDPQDRSVFQFVGKGVAAVGGVHGGVRIGTDMPGHGHGR